MKKIQILTTLATLGFFVSPASAASMLVNGDFEAGNLSGWNNNGGALGQPGVGAQSGVFSALLTTAVNGVPEINQSFAASAGQEFNFSGFMLTPALLPAGPSFGLLKIVFRDAGNVDLQVAQASIGTIVGPGFPGVESAQVNSTSNINTWYFLEAQATAPANTATVLFLALDVEFNGGNHPVYVDNLQASLVPEPTSFVLGGLGALGLLVRRRRR
jgi:hypothetical protein